jgi:hypothetical protein
MKPRLILYGKHHPKVGISKKENISHLCCYDESFKSGYNFGTDIIKVYIFWGILRCQLVVADVSKVLLAFQASVTLYWLKRRDN